MPLPSFFFHGERRGSLGRGIVVLEFVPKLDLIPEDHEYNLRGNEGRECEQ